MRLTIFGALPRELKYVIRDLGATKSSEGWTFPVHTVTTGRHNITIVQTGMGMARAGAALSAVLERFEPDCVISLGFAGALYHGTAPGDLVIGSRILLLREYGGGSATASLAPSEVAPRRPLPGSLAEKLAGMGALHEGSIITLEQQLEKSMLAERIPPGLPFPVCDMETFGIAEVCLRKEIPFLAVRAISDALDVEVPPELVGVVDEAGQPNLGRLFYAVTTNPALVTDVLRLRRSSETAAQKLGQFVEELCRAA